MFRYQRVHFIRVISLQLLLMLAACSGSDGGSSSASSLPSLNVSDVTIEEQSVAISYYVSLSRTVDTTATVKYQLLDGTAVAGEDYMTAAGELSFSAGVSQAVIYLQLIDDADEEGDESFVIRFYDASGIRLVNDQVTVTIAANDAISWTPMAEFDPHWSTLGAFSNAETCASCHSGSEDDSGVLRFPKQADGDDISPFNGWKHTAMAHAFDDPYFQAVVQDEARHFPALAGTVEDKCLTCHSPMARNHAHSTGIGLEADACLSVDGCYRMESAHQSMAAREGVSCTLCHQVDPANLGTAFSGSYVIGDSKVIYGPYDDPLTNPMANNTQYTVTGGAHMQSSAQCAVCHNLKTPSVDVNTGELTGREFVEQAPYTEWFNSTFNEGDAGDKQCQDCHMPEIEGYSSQIATMANGNANLNWPERDAYSQHLFLGGNNYLLALLRDYRDELGIENTTSVAGFDQQISLNSAFLQNQAADIAISQAEIVDNQLNIDVLVTNKAGHKIPTSFPSRRAWVNLIVKDDSGNTLFESGTPDSRGYLSFDGAHASDDCIVVVKTDVYNSSDCLMPHYDVIDNAEKVAVYEAVMGDTNQQVTYVLLHGDQYLKDNRLPPAGFKHSGSRYNSEVSVVGAALADSDFNKDAVGNEGSGSDTVHYRLAWLDKPAENLQIEATFFYQTIRPAFVGGLHNNGDKIDRFKSMYEAKSPAPVAMAVSQYHLP